MSTSETAIMNSALVKLGADRILSPNDDSNRARLVKAQYPLRRDALLASHPWRFNKGYQELAMITPKPPEYFDYAYAFQLPSDCARVFTIDGCGVESWEEVGNGVLLCNKSTVIAKYGRKITDASKFDANFAECLAWDLASDLAYSLIESASQVQTLREIADREMARARSYSAQRASIKQVGAQSWLNARR